MRPFRSSGLMHFVSPCLVKARRTSLTLLRVIFESILFASLKI